MNKFLCYLLFGFWLLCSGTTCDDRDECLTPKSIEFNSYFESSQQEITLGDTLFMRSKFPALSAVIDESELVEVSFASLRFDLVAFDGNNPETTDALQGFEFIGEVGEAQVGLVVPNNINSNVSWLTIEYECDELWCSARTSIIPSEPGLYCLVMKNGSFISNSFCEGLPVNNFLFNEQNLELFDDNNIQVFQVPPVEASQDIIVANQGAILYPFRVVE